MLQLAYKIILQVVENIQFLNKLPLYILGGMIILLCCFIYLLRINIRKINELNKLNSDEESKLQLILNSTAEGIYGFDKNGRCTFLNRRCLELLGYESKEELLGKSVHQLLHHSRRDGTPMPIEECKVWRSLQTGKGIFVDDEVFWRADGTCFDVEYYAYPQLREGKVVGGVITFYDATEKKNREKELYFLSYHDELTGLYNSRYIKEKLKNIDKESNLPISVISGDLNGLKQTNDIFGHEEGNILIKNTAEVMKKVFRKDDIIARMGGDEFIIILPRTEKSVAENIIKEVKAQLSLVPSRTFDYNISMGCETKSNMDEDIWQVFKRADDNMYMQKVLDQRKFNKKMISSLFKNFMDQFPQEKIHALNVSKLCYRMGIQLNLSASEIRLLREAGYMHDIGKITFDKNLMDKKEPSNYYEWNQLKEHPVIGFRILNSSDYTMDIAKYVISHHENWDGTGYPKGLKDNEIPLISRIIAIANRYDNLRRGMFHQTACTKKEAIDTIRMHAGTEFDPQLVEVFIKMLENNEEFNKGILLYTTE